MSTVTVTARKQLEEQVDHYVSSVVVRYGQDSLARWNVPVCPLVAGLPRERGEYILWRITQVATASGAPLAPQQCKVNFYVVVTPQPDVLLKNWLRRDPKMYDRASGMSRINSFMHATHPIRCWYNTEFRSSDGGSVSREGVVAALNGSALEMMELPTNTVRLGTRLRYSAIQGLSSIIIVVDENQTGSLTIGQLADYVAMIGLAQIRTDADLGQIPTILRLFQDPQDPPQAMSTWDEAFLHSLYGTSQASVTQRSLIKTRMLDRIAPP